MITYLYLIVLIFHVFQVALIAFVAVAAAEPQWGVEHMKTPSGDTVSVQAAKVQHHQMKAAEYVKKGYASPVVYANTAAYSGVPVYNQGIAAPVYNHGVYSYGLHHLGKRDADSDSQMIYSTGIQNSYPYYNTFNKVYNSGVYGSVVPATYAAPIAPAYNHGVYSGVYSGLHSIGKRDADSDSQMVYSTQFGGYPYTNTATFGNLYNAGVYGSAYPATHAYKTGVYSSYPSTYYSGYTGHRVFKREAEADSQWAYNNVYTPYAGYTGYTGYTAPYNYGNVWNRAQYVW